MKQIAIGVMLGALILAVLWILPSAHAERVTIPFLSPPIPPVPPLCGPGQTNGCVPWREELRDWREAQHDTSPLAPPPAPARHCGKRYGENWCD